VEAELPMTTPSEGEPAASAHLRFSRSGGEVAPDDRCHGAQNTSLT